MSDPQTNGTEPTVVVKEEDSTTVDVPVDTPEVKCVVMATSMNLQPPSFVSDSKTYKEYKRELKGWALVTTVEKSKQAIVVALSIPDEAEGNIKNKIFAEMDTDSLNVDEGMKTLLDFPLPC